MVIDDLNRNHVCDYLFQQSLGSKKPTSKKNIFTGDKYFIVDEKYIKPHKIIKNNKKRNLEILINFGSNDVKNLTCKFLKYIKLNLLEYKIYVVVEDDFKFFQELKKLVNKRVIIYKNQFSLYNLTLKSDICIGAGGMHNIERVSLGKLSYVVKTSENQKNNINYLKQKKLIIYLGTKNKFNFNLIRFENFKNNFLNSQSLKLKKNLHLNGILNISKIINQIN